MPVVSQPTLANIATNCLEVNRVAGVAVDCKTSSLDAVVADAVRVPRLRGGFLAEEKKDIFTKMKKRTGLEYGKYDTPEKVKKS